MTKPPIPPELLQRPPAIWMPRKGPVLVKLPYNPADPALNRRWLKEVLGNRIRLKHAGGVWAVARGHADTLRVACGARFGPGGTTVITDASQQVKCGSRCQNGNSNNVLSCECQCGGRNHGGVVDGWTMRGEFAIDTTVTRRVFLV